MIPEEVVRRYYSLVDAQEFAELVQLFSKDSVYRRPGYEPLVGREALSEFYSGRRVITGGRHAISELLADGPKVAVAGEFAGTVTGGQQVDVRFADFFTLDADGLICTRDTFFFAPLV
jgi:ketosteroid isomerase-like protein